jgi:Arc/MetJ-type ribon-helix-helix transcriptional regulator
LPRKKGKPFARADELKKRYNISLTPIAHEGLKRLVEEGNFESLSEVLEQLGRGELVFTEAQEGFKPTLADLMVLKQK